MKKFVIQFFILSFAIVRINFETTLKIGNMMERLQKIASLSDGSGEISDCKSAYIGLIWHVLCTFITYIYML